MNTPPRPGFNIAARNRMISRPMTAAEWQAAEAAVEKKGEEEAQACEAARLAKKPRIKRAPIPRPVYDWTDFRVPNADDESVQNWFETHPELKGRAWYIIQQHHATAKHFDLRIHLNGVTISWAVPKGLSRIPKPPFAPGDKSRHVLAVETDPHPINYSLYEGSGIGTTLVWDIGSYKMLPTKSSLDRKRAEEEPDTTDEDEETVEPEEEEEDLPEDYRQEDLFLEGLQRGRFQAVPPAWGRPGKPWERQRAVNSKQKRGLAIELNGERYQGLQLLFNRRENMYKNTRPKGTPKDEHLLIRSNEWLIRRYGNSAQPPLPGEADTTENMSLGTQSILTKRTMDEVKDAAYAEQVNREEREAFNWEWPTEGMGYEGLQGLLGAMGSGGGENIEWQEYDADLWDRT